MFENEWSIQVPGAREWPTLRDLYMRADDHQRHDPLAAAVAEATRPAEAWSARLTAMLGRGCRTLFARDGDGDTRGFVSAYGDGQEHDLVVIVRSLLVVPSPAEDLGRSAANALLAEVEQWSVKEGALEVLFEIDAGDAALADVLAARGYSRSGVTRPPAELHDDGFDDEAVEWTRKVGSVRARSERALFAVAS